MGDHSYVAGTVIGPNGEPFGPLSASPPDIGTPAGQDRNYEEAEPLSAPQVRGALALTAPAPAGVAPTATLTHVLNVARSQLGFVEGPNNSNRYGQWYGWNNVPYCAIGLTWTFAMANGLDQIGGKPGEHWAYCPYWVSYWKGVGRWHGHTEAARPGDIVFFDWGGDHQSAEHVGIVESIDHVGPTGNVPVLVTLEWNTTSGVAGDQSEGGGVYRRRRSLLYVLGYGRPVYAQQARPVPIPSRGDTRKLMPLIVDGVWGPATTKHLQVWLRVKPTGVIDRTTRRRLQEALHVTADGIWGPVTHRALQHRLGVTADGAWGPITAKALQRFLNRTV